MENSLGLLHVPVPYPPLDLVLLVLKVSPPSRLHIPSKVSVSLGRNRLGVLHARLTLSSSRFIL